MMKELFSHISTKGKLMLATAILANTISSLLFAGIMLTVFRMLTAITGGQKDLTGYWRLMLTMLAVKFIANIIVNGTTHFAGFEMEVNLKEKIIRRLKQFSLGFYTQERLGEISTIVQNDVDNLEGAVAHIGSKAVSDILTALVIGIALWLLDWKMGLVMVSLLPLALGIQAAGLKKSLILKEKNKRNLADMVSRFVEYTKGIPLLKAFPENEFFQKQLKESARRFEESSKAEAKAGAWDSAQYFIPLELCFALLALLGGLLTWYKLLDLDNYVYFIVFSQEFYRPFANLESYRLSYTGSKDSYERIARLLDVPILTKPAVAKSAARFDIHFEHVGFQYEEKGFALQDADFVLEQGSLTALVGPSGSGKTTITNLLLRFWDCQSGKIEIGGVDIRDMDYDELLAQISIVMQNVILFADTVYENIKMGNSRATREQVIEAAQKAMIHETIMSLPEGYDTLLGENGAGLSGGQKQRLAIARALLKDSPIVLLDEATSNVDPLNEVYIQKAISNLALGRTVLVIAHHLQTIQSADRILVFQAGQLLEAGRHSELIDKGGLYYKLWTAQQQAKTWGIGSRSA
ncbi:ABC transporter ATP-binding protein [Desulfosporosinus sp. PR]|uniref:ABC transporter ATP-binding protein n=1 Tax=Candidatus Desulfosporosinus nitrosoreducens TaxID=3401928 RepID=UPI0027FFD530|nr:ABC transporter ATP-binding protein [Desulfosporosinus sp. PR]MDQ7092075.1 ABC transporter ATP-binding protein [Desulfosporosinus sp. PR]